MKTKVRRIGEMLRRRDKDHKGIIFWFVFKRNHMNQFILLEIEKYQLWKGKKPSLIHKLKKIKRGVIGEDL